MDDPSRIVFSYRICENSHKSSIADLLNSIKSYQSDNISIQIINPEWIISREHIQVAIYHTLKAFKNGSNFAREKETELLVRLSGLNQIKNAVKSFGINEKMSLMLVVTFGGTLEENSKILEQFCLENKFKSVENIDFPLTNKFELSKYYKTEKNTDKLDKIVFEMIAALDIL